MNRVETVDVYTCRGILRLRAGIEQHSPPDGFGEYYWTELLRGCAESDGLEATWGHYRTRTRPLTPADIDACGDSNDVRAWPVGACPRPRPAEPALEPDGGGGTFREPPLTCC